MNTLSATITAVSASEHLSILTASVGEDHLHLLLAEQYHDAIGTSLTLAFKETEVILSKTRIATTANIQRAFVHTIENGIILSHITLSYQELTLSALVPTLTFNTLDISEGDEVYWMVSPSEISLLRERHGI
jgi:molybdopterin-binding protein